MNKDSTMISKEKKTENDTKKELSKLIKYINPFISSIIFAVICSTIAAIMLIKGATEISDLVDIIKDIILGESTLANLKKVSIKIIIIYSVYFLFSATQGTVMAFIQQKIICKLREDLESKRQKLCLGTIIKLNTGDTLSIIINDVSKFSLSFNTVAIELFPAIVLFAGTIFAMVSRSMILTISVVVSAVLGFVLIGFIMSKSQKYYTKQQKILGDINGQIEEVYNGEIVVKAFGREKKVIQDFNKINDKMRSINYKTFCFQAFLMPIMTLINNLGYISVCIIGAILITKNSISFGVIASFLMYLNIFQEPIAKIGSTSQNLQMMISSSKRIFDFLELEEMPADASSSNYIEKVNGDVKFNNVCFGYEPKKRMIITDFNLHVKSGQNIAIVGQTGAGKTTLINLLLRFFDINSGEILIDDIPLNNISRHNVRDLFSSVPQDAWIFNGTLRENLTLSLSKISDEKLDEVCKAVGIYHYISTLPNGYDTIISEKNGLSLGQKQQLSIARAMLADKNMVILDEATSSVDVLLEKQIKEAMDQLIKGKTAFIIAHRLSTIKNADKIIVMKNGNVVESGTHQELIESNGVYAEMLNSQWDNS